MLPKFVEITFSDGSFARSEVAYCYARTLQANHRHFRYFDPKTHELEWERGLIAVSYSSGTRFAVTWPSVNCITVRLALGRP